MRLNRTLALGASVLVLFGACTTGGGGDAVTSAPQPGPSPAGGASPSRWRRFAVRGRGNDARGHQDRIGRLLRVAAWSRRCGPRSSRRTGFKVDRHFNIGARQVRQPALEQGQIDLVPEYVGSGLGYYDKTKTTGDGQQNHDELQAIVDRQGRWPDGLQHQPGPGHERVRRPRRHRAASSTSRRSATSLAQQASSKLGPARRLRHEPALLGRAEGRLRLHLSAGQAQGARTRARAPMAQALQGKAIDIAELCSTQPAIGQFGFKVLDDDKKTQPAENIAAMVRNDYLAKVGDTAAFQALLDARHARSSRPTS